MAKLAINVNLDIVISRLVRTKLHGAFASLLLVTLAACSDSQEAEVLSASLPYPSESVVKPLVVHCESEEAYRESKESRSIRDGGYIGKRFGAEWVDKRLLPSLPAGCTIAHRTEDTIVSVIAVNKDNYTATLQIPGFDEPRWVGHIDARIPPNRGQWLGPNAVFCWPEDHDRYGTDIQDAIGSYVVARHKRDSEAAEMFRQNLPATCAVVPNGQYYAFDAIDLSLTYISELGTRKNLAYGRISTDGRVYGREVYAMPADVTFEGTTLTPISEHMVEYGGNADPLDPKTAVYFEKLGARVQRFISSGSVVCDDSTSAWKATAIISSGNQYVQFPDSCMTIGGELVPDSIEYERNVAVVRLQDGSVFFTPKMSISSRVTRTRSH